MRTTVAAATTVLALLAGGPVAADDLDEGRAAYTKTCSKCHGNVTEQSAWRPGAGRVLPAVMAPQGPNLTGIFGRPAGTVPGFRYSDALKRAAPEIVWDAPALDRWLADSQAMVKGSYMFLKLKPAMRALVIDYLERVAPYQP